MSKKKIKRPPQYKRPQERTLKEWWQDQTEQTKKRILYACIAVAAVIALICIYYYGFYDDGSLKVKDNAAVGAQDNWLIGERSGGKNSHYYHLADVSVPEGMTVQENSTTTSTPRKDFYFDGTGEAEGVTIYVAGVNSSVQGMIDSVYDRFVSLIGENGTITGVNTLNTALGEGQYFSYQQHYQDENQQTRYTQSLVLYAPTAYKDSCVLISASAVPENEESLLSEELLLAQVEKAIEGITLIKK